LAGPRSPEVRRGDRGTRRARDARRARRPLLTRAGPGHGRRRHWRQPARRAVGGRGTPGALVGRDRARLIRGAADSARRPVRCDARRRGARCLGAWVRGARCRRAWCRRARPPVLAGRRASGPGPGAGLRPRAVRRRDAGRSVPSIPSVASVARHGRARGRGTRCLLALRLPLTSRLIWRRRGGGKRLLEPPDHGRLYRRGCRSYELAHFLELVHDGLALDTELLREFVNPDFRHYAPSRPSPLDPLPDPSPGRACSGPASAYGHHRRVLIERSSASRPAFRQVFLLALTACCPARLFRRQQCYSGDSAPQRYSARPARLSDPAVRSARGNARRRRARSRHTGLGCRYAPRPGSRACGSGWMTSPTATMRSRLDLAARSLQPTQVRVTGVPGACCSDRSAIPLISLPCPHVAGVGRDLRFCCCFG